MSEFDKLIDAAKRGDLADVKSILESHSELVHERDQSGAAALHYATFGGHRSVVEELVKQGADINATDTQFGATPAGWAIEYLREMGGFLGIELSDLELELACSCVFTRGRGRPEYPFLVSISSARPHFAREGAKVYE